jgi:hypothetical protein
MSVAQQRDVLQTLPERPRDMPRPIECERNQLLDLGADRGMSTQVVEAGLVRSVPAAIRPEQEEQHPGEALLAFGQLFVGGVRGPDGEHECSPSYEGLTFFAA